jgi:HEAT repeat protein
MAKSISDILAEVADVEKPLAAESIYRLSSLNEEDLKTVQAKWGAIDVERRRTLVQRVAETSETNFDMDFTLFTRIALTDLDDEVRESAIESAWNDESPDMATRLMAMASGDIAENVRAAAIAALGNTILLGELGKFDSQVARRAENVALKLYNDPNESLEVRRRALEAIANSSREGVSEMIEDAYDADDTKFKASAIFAMGRSCDQKWSKTVLRELRSEDAELRFEATRSAGELEIKQAIPYLADILQEDDREIMEMAVWSLGEIGGPEARRLLEDMAERADELEDEDLVEAVDEALQMASLVGEDLDL